MLNFDESMDLKSKKKKNLLASSNNHHKSNTPKDNVSLINNEQFDKTQNEEKKLFLYEYENLIENLSTIGEPTNISTTFSQTYQEGDSSTLSQEEDYSNLNQHITDKLEKVLEFYTANNEEFRALAYRRAISTLKNFPVTITSIDQVNNIPYICKSKKR